MNLNDLRDQQSMHSAAEANATPATAATAPPAHAAPRMEGEQLADPLRAASISFDAQAAADTKVPAFADGAFNHLHPDYIKVERIGWAIFGGIMSLGLIIMFPIVLFTSGVFSLPPYILLAGGLVVLTPIILAGIFHPRKSWQNTTYAVSPLGLEIRRGIWWKHMIDVPRSRIQHTDVAQGPLARSFGIGKLIVYTAGTEHASVELDGLEYDRAIQMRDFLLRGGEDDAV